MLTPVELAPIAPSVAKSDAAPKPIQLLLTTTLLIKPYVVVPWMAVCVVMIVFWPPRMMLPVTVTPRTLLPPSLVTRIALLVVCSPGLFVQSM